MLLLRCLCLALLLPALSTKATEESFLTLKLVSETESIQPGKPFFLGISLHHAPGWHTYWKYPGVVGVPTSIKWLDLPAGFKADPISWPEPEGVLMFQIKAQGYERDVVLPIRVTPPETLKAGTSITLSGQAAYMCCNRECHPGFQKISITLPVKNEAPCPSEWAKKIHHELSLRPAASKAWTATAIESATDIVLTLTPGKGASQLSPAEASKLTFFTEDGLVDTDKPQKIQRLEDGSLVLTLVKTGYIVGDKPTSVTGDLVHPPGWEADGKVRCLRLTAPLKSM